MAGDPGSKLNEQFLEAHSVSQLNRHPTHGRGESVNSEAENYPPNFLITNKSEELAVDVSVDSSSRKEPGLRDSKRQENLAVVEDFTDRRVTQAIVRFGHIKFYYDQRKLPLDSSAAK